jgi:hypothetical protein
MKKLVLAVCLLMFIAEAKAQYPKLIVQFTNKGTNPFTISNPSQYLSSRAITRRTKYNIAIDSSDLPIVPRYIDSVLSKGPVTLLSRSKWLNQILIQCTDQPTINGIMALPFVKRVQGIGFRMSAPKDKFNEQSTPKTATNLRPMADVFSYGQSYNQVHIHEGEFLHNKGYSGQSMVIAMLDAGFSNYKTITAFDSVRLNGQILGERDFVTYDNSVNEDDAHGMQCFSTIAANKPNQMVGTAPKASFWLLRTENAFSEYPIEEHNWVVGAEFADSSGADMISSSLGYYDFDDPSFDHTYNDFYKNATQVTQGATYAAKKGLIVVNSAGNEGNKPWKYLVFPADADSVCAVGAVNSAGSAAGFSSYGYPGKVKPNIASVGEGTTIINSLGNVSAGNGTSFAAPNIAGLIACLWQAFPQFNNMKILDAVYKSCPTYATPNDRRGFGIPNMRTAYRLLKHDQNVALYGNKKLFASPNPFTTQIDIRVIGRIDGDATVQMLSPTNTVVATKNLSTEVEEVYNFSFTNLGIQPGGLYVVKYTDVSSTDTVQLTKISTAPPMTDWLVAYPSPFRNAELGVYLKAPETAKVSLRIVDMVGRVFDKVELNTTQGSIYTISLNNIFSLPAGVYTIEYIGKEKKRVRVVKQ